MYMAFKHAHTTFALLSILFFIVRAYWSVAGSSTLQRKWVKISPHVIDTLLLACAIALMVITAQYPFVQGWVTAKLLGLIVYIGVGTMAIKRGKTPQTRLAFSIIAVVVFVYIGAVAMTKSPFLNLI